MLFKPKYQYQYYSKQIQTLYQKPAILQHYQLTGRERVTSHIQRAAASYGEVAPGPWSRA